MKRRLASCGRIRGCNISEIRPREKWKTQTKRLREKWVLERERGGDRYLEIKLRG